MTTTNEHTERAELICKLKRRAMASTNPELSSELMDAAAMLEAQRPALKPMTDEQIETLAKPFIRSLGGDHWHSGEDGIPDRGQVEEFARAIEAAHGIKEQA